MPKNGSLITKKWDHVYQKNMIHRVTYWGILDPFKCQVHWLILVASAKRCPIFQNVLLQALIWPTETHARKKRGQQCQQTA